MSLQEHLERRRAEIQKEQDELALVEALAKKYPDLKRHVNRWKRERFTSASVNSLCVDYDMAHNCGCCNDSPLELWPYVKEGETRIYADGIPFVIGEKNPYSYRDDAYDGWEDKLRAANFPQELIDKVARHFVVYDEDEDTEDEPEIELELEE